MLTAAREKAREGFQMTRDLPPGELTENGIAHARDVAKILRHNIVQGQAVEEGSKNFSENHRF